MLGQRITSPHVCFIWNWGITPLVLVLGNYPASFELGLAESSLAISIHDHMLEGGGGGQFNVPVVACNAIL